METMTGFDETHHAATSQTVHAGQRDQGATAEPSLDEKSASQENQQQSTAPQDPFFTMLEARVIACLMEKQLTTPNNYPLTLNSLTNACNQKSNREPVMKLTEGQVGHTVNALVDRKLAGLDYGERSNKVSHRVVNTLELNRKQQAVLTVLMLRKPQTLNDIRVRTARMAEFNDASEVLDTLEQLMNREKPLAVLIPKGAGRREERYAHTLCGDIPLEQIESRPTDSSLHFSDLEQDIDIERLEALEARIAAIEKELGLSTA